MNKIQKRLVSTLLVALLAAGNMVMPVSSAAWYDVPSYTPTTGGTGESGIKPFTSTADLIKDTIADLLEQGEEAVVVADDEALEEIVTEKSEFSLDEVLSSLAMSFMTNRETGYVDTTKYQLDEEEMSEVLERALSKFYLMSKVDYEFDVDDGIVVGIDFTLKNSFAAALDSIAENNGTEAAEAVVVGAEESGDTHFASGFEWGDLLLADGEADIVDGGTVVAYKNSATPLEGDTRTIDVTAKVGQTIVVKLYNGSGYDNQEGEAKTFSFASNKNAVATVQNDNGVRLENRYTYGDLVTDPKSLDLTISCLSEGEATVTCTGETTGGSGSQYFAYVNVTVEAADVSGGGSGETCSHAAVMAVPGNDMVITPNLDNGYEMTANGQMPLYRMTYQGGNIVPSNTTTIQVDYKTGYLYCMTCEQPVGQVELTNTENYSYVSVDADTGVISVFRSDVYGVMWDNDTNYGVDLNSNAVTLAEDGKVFYQNSTPTQMIEPILSVNPPMGEPTTPEEYQAYQAYMAYYPYINCLVREVTYPGADGEPVSALMNVSDVKLKLHWTEMSEFINNNQDYYGVSVPYWTSKNTNANPLAAIKSLCNMDVDAEVPAGNMDYMVEMLNQAFMAYVYQYGDLLLDMRDAAMDVIDHDGLTRMQKMLLLHDWLAKNATFDMQGMVASRSGESAGADPISMTPFGTIMSYQLGTGGAVCLGYAAAYQYLVQNAFTDDYKNEDGTWKDASLNAEGTNVDQVANHIIDFVQIRFHADVAETSVAGTESGFGEATIFNEPHYFNAVKLESDIHGHTGGRKDGNSIVIDNDDDDAIVLDADRNCWYYIDACYDDISTQVISQYRVETAGNISHVYMFNSPQTFVAQFDGNYDYFDSAYDGLKYQKIQTGTDAMGKPVYEIGEDGLPVWEKLENEAEVAYNDTQFEQTWFSNVVSEIVCDGDYWYYVEGQASSYASMKDIFGDDEEGGNDFNIDDISPEMMETFKNDPDSADKLKRRPRYENGSVIGDRPASDDEGNDDFNYGDMSFSMNSYDDKYAEILFHFGYGAVDPVQEAGESDDDYTARMEEIMAEGTFAELIEADKTYNEQYPDLNHSIGFYDDKLYFNLANRVMVYDLEDDDVDTKVSQLKEYNDVEAYTNSNPFTGASFFTNTEDSKIVALNQKFTALTEAFAVADYPISSICITDWVVLNPTDGSRTVIPMMLVSVGTNYSNSYTVEIDGEKIPYVKEAVNFNPDYYRFMDDGTEDENTNVEFMWCTSIIDAMAMDSMLADTEAETVVLDANCTRNSFTDVRTTMYGLSDGSERVEASEKDMLNHHYSHDNAEAGYVCFRCNGYLDDATVDETTVYDNFIHENCVLNPAEDVWNWTEDKSACTHEIRSCSVADCPENEVHTDVTVTSEEENGATVYTATCECGETDTITIDVVCEHAELTKTEAVAATCKDKGMLAYWTCAECDKVFSDAEGTTEVTDLTTLETAKDSEKHVGGTEVRNAVAATENVPGYTGDTYCLGCDTKLADGEEIPATGVVETEEITLTVSDIQARAGETGVKATLSIENLPEAGLGYLKLSIDYDADILTLVDVEDAGILGTFTESQTADTKPYIVVWDSVENLGETGKILEMTFDIVKIEEFEASDDILTITCVECTNLEREDVDCSVDYGTIKIDIPGDANDDGYVSGKDLILLRQYMAEMDVTIHEANADVNADGYVSGKDVILLRQYLAEWDVELQ